MFSILLTIIFNLLRKKWPQTQLVVFEAVLNVIATELRTMVQFRDSEWPVSCDLLGKHQSGGML